MADNFDERIKQMENQISEALGEEEEEDNFRSSHSRPRGRSSYESESQATQSSLRRAKLELREERMLRQRDARKAAQKLQKQEAAYEKQQKGMRVMLTEIEQLRDKTARLKADLKHSSTSTTDVTRQQEVKLSKLQDKIAVERHRASIATRDLKRARHQLEQASFRGEQELWIKISQLQARLADADAFTEEQEEESISTAGRLERQLRQATHRAEDAEARLLQQLPSRSQSESHAVALAAAQRRERGLRARVEALEASQRSGRLQHERIIQLEAKVLRVQAKNEEMTDCMDTAARSRQRCEAWVEAAKAMLRTRPDIDSAEGAAPMGTAVVATPALMSARVGELQRQCALLLRAKGDAAAAESRARQAEDAARGRAAVAEAEGTALREEMAATKARLATEQQWHSLLRKDNLSLRKLNKLCRRTTAAEGPAGENAGSGLRDRIDTLEGLLQKTQTINATLTLSVRVACAQRDRAAAAAAAHSPPVGIDAPVAIHATEAAGNSSNAKVKAGGAMEAEGAKRGTEVLHITTGMAAASRAAQFISSLGSQSFVSS